MSLLRIHSRIAVSHANGPGARSVIWTQGCDLACPGCFNPETHESTLGDLIDTSELVAWVQANEVEGVTISGGEPLAQADASLDLARRCSDAGLTVVMFSGYSWRYLSLRQPALLREVSENVDVLLAGRYDQSKRSARGLRGSSNKTVHLLSSAYSQADIEEVPEAEIMISPSGQVTYSGVDPAVPTSFLV